MNDEDFAAESEMPSLLSYIQFLQCFETGTSENKASAVISRLFNLLPTPPRSAPPVSSATNNPQNPEQPTHE